MRALIANSQYPVYCNTCRCVREAVFQESSANSSPVWLRCGECGLFDVEAPFHRYGGLNGYGRLFKDLYLTVEEAKSAVAQWDGGSRGKGRMVIEWVESQEGEGVE